MPSDVVLAFDNPRMTGSYPDKYQFLLGVGAYFQLIVNGTTVMDEPDFTIVELRQWLKQWLDAGAQTDFVYTSIEAEEEGLVVFRKVGEDIGEVDSAWSQSGVPQKAPWTDIIDACHDYISSVDCWFCSECHVDLESELSDLR